jgi:hypothetical protein
MGGAKAIPITSSRYPANISAPVVFLVDRMVKIGMVPWIGQRYGVWARIFLNDGYRCAPPILRTAAIAPCESQLGQVRRIGYDAVRA